MGRRKRAQTSPEGHSTELGEAWIQHRNEIKMCVGTLLPGDKRKLTISDLSLQGWRQVAPPIPHAICPEQTANLVAYDLMQHGYPNEALGILMSLDCYLRVRDLCSFTVNDVVLTKDKKTSHSVELLISKTKTGILQCALIRLTFLGELIKLMVSRRQPIAGDKARSMGFHQSTILRRARSSILRLEIWQDCIMH